MTSKPKTVCYLLLALVGCTGATAPSLTFDVVSECASPIVVGVTVYAELLNDASNRDSAFRYDTLAKGGRLSSAPIQVAGDYWVKVMWAYAADWNGSWSVTSSNWALQEVRPIPGEYRIRVLGGSPC
jgi:hypothetical protein